ncbi:Clp protease N-terminal domain-containing protein [Actinomadura algeriensis]|uniref:ATP-dependent Clp protease ATP-binding subunit ClpA n=1 Tax=Actinomadura algeriensis TaxID=1679523 RepID=A0ABR9JM25_9ACTN|nr:Clp protease N-terminal domain-containing protein [Actinomadura algeriensis]MBE1531607.1 ATP-dependent Clp protease ATP-binding subunit ClpA [Actinomadura algeriensis]
MTDVSPYTPVARRVLESASVHAAALGHQNADTGHLLLGVITGHRRGMACAVLRHMSVEFVSVQRHVEESLGLGTLLGQRDVPLSAAAWDAIQLGLRENPVAGPRRVGTDHLVLGLLAEGGVAARALRAHDVTPERFSAARGNLQGVCYGCAEGRTGEAHLSAGLAEELEALIAQVHARRQARTAAIEAEDYVRAAQERDREQETLRRGVQTLDTRMARTHLVAALEETMRLRQQMNRLVADLGHRH